MDATARKCAAVIFCAAVLLGSAACSNFDLANSSAPAAQAPATGSQPWTTPPNAGSPQFAARPAPAASLQPAPRALGTAGTAGSAPLPPPPAWPLDPNRPRDPVPVPAAPVAPVAAAPCAPPPPPPTRAAPTLTRRVVPPRARKGCGLLCEDGISKWHIRAVGGAAFFSGTDSAENCLYWGADIGRTFCGCWGLDAYYRYNSGRFDLLTPPGLVKDGGGWHHIGGKLTFEKGFSRGSRLYWWAGLGAGYFWTQDYFQDDSGIEGYGEAGIGYVLNDTWRVRVGVNVHGMDTNVTRLRAWPVAPGTNDRSSRWLWIIAPVGQIEADF